MSEPRELAGVVPAWLETWAWTLLAMLFYVPVSLGSLLWLLYLGGEWALWTRTIGENWMRDVGLGLAAGLVVVAGTRAVSGFRSMIAMRAAIREIFGTMPLGAVLGLALFSAVGEELLFRAVLQSHLGLVVASALFAAVHIPTHRSLLLWPAFAFVSGLLFGALYLYTGAVLAPVMAHFVINALNLRWCTS